MTAAKPTIDRRLRLSLLGGAIYFALVALAHGLGLKVPVLFVYFDLPSYGYQDSIIGFLCFGWSAFFFSAARHPENSRGAVLVAGVAAILGLAAINSHTDFRSLAGAARIWAYWLEFAAALAYLTWLSWLFRCQGRSQQPGATTAHDGRRGRCLEFQTEEE